VNNDNRRGPVGEVTVLLNGVNGAVALPMPGVTLTVAFIDDLVHVHAVTPGGEEVMCMTMSPHMAGGLRAALARPRGLVKDVAP
jgi:hypothetical protein